MADILVGHYAKAVKAGVDMWWNQVVDSYFEEFAQVFEKRISGQNFEEHVQVENFPIAQVKDENAPIVYATSQQGFIQRYQHITYGLGYGISWEAIEDNKYVQLAEERTKSLLASMMACRETVAWNILNRAFNSSFTYADGVELCSTANVLHTGGTYTNKLATDADMSEASLEQMTIDIGSAVGDNNMKVALMPQMLIVPVALQYEAKRILGSMNRVATTDNDINAMRAMNVFPKGVMVSHYLTDNDAYFIQTDARNGLIYFDRSPLMMMNDTPEFDTDEMKFKGRMRFSVGVTNKLALFGSAGA